MIDNIRMDWREFTSLLPQTVARNVTSSTRDYYLRSTRAHVAQEAISSRIRTCSYSSGAFEVNPTVQHIAELAGGESDAAIYVRYASRTSFHDNLKALTVLRRWKKHPIRNTC